MTELTPELTAVELAEFIEGPWVDLSDHINQNGVRPGPRKLEQFIEAMELRRVPKLYSQENVKDPVVRVKLFDPCGSWTWYITEFSKVAPDGCTNLAFGYVIGHEKELGYIHIEELATVKGGMGIGIEIDTHFNPQLLSKFRDNNE